MDSLFLIGAARVALDQLAQSATVRMRVPVEDAGLWSETIARLADVKVKPAVIGDAELHLGDCILETDLGVADIGAVSQLTEISRVLLNGFSAAAPAGDLQTIWKNQEGR